MIIIMLVKHVGPGEAVIENNNGNTIGIENIERNAQIYYYKKKGLFLGERNQEKQERQ